MGSKITWLESGSKSQRMGSTTLIYSLTPSWPRYPIEETMICTDHIVRQGKALYIGFSNYSHETAKAFSILRKLGTPCLFISQIFLCPRDGRRWPVLMFWKRKELAAFPSLHLHKACSRITISMYSWWLARCFFLMVFLQKNNHTGIVKR